MSQEQSLFRTGETGGRKRYRQAVQRENRHLQPETPEGCDPPAQLCPTGMGRRYQPL